ncbi:MAG: TRAP-type mannitol/chloroaromatic compound transport system, small permease component [Rhodobacteraceae bacterium HLUCCA12]|nr:MAG: TRAP-type mannitol/chloroaromatic compound transport system, small permease component [Rhodobacteraceae bacterium HLUCCA12]
MTRLADACDTINRAVGAVVMWLALIMVLLQFGVVLLRYVFGFSSIFLNESVLYLHATIFMLGAGYTLWAQGHVRVDIFYARFPAHRKALVDLLGHLFLLVPSVLMLLYWSWPMVHRSWAILEGPISVGGIPASFLLKSLVPAFCLLLLVQGVSALIRDVIRLQETRDGA